MCNNLPQINKKMAFIIHIVIWLNEQRAYTFCKFIWYDKSWLYFLISDSEDMYRLIIYIVKFRKEKREKRFLNYILLNQKHLTIFNGQYYTLVWKQLHLTPTLSKNCNTFVESTTIVWGSLYKVELQSKIHFHPILLNSPSKDTATDHSQLYQNSWW